MIQAMILAENIEKSQKKKNVKCRLHRKDWAETSVTLNAKNVFCYNNSFYGWSLQTMSNIKQSIFAVFDGNQLVGDDLKGQCHKM